MTDLATAAYVEARIAFWDCPDARINTDDGVRPDAVFVRVRERLDGEVFALSYSVLRVHHEDRPALTYMAEAARSKWGYEMERREPSEPFDMARLTEHVRRWALPNFPLDVHVNQSWGGEMRMRLDLARVVLSPAAYRDVRLADD